MSVEENLDLAAKGLTIRQAVKKEIIELLGLGQLLQRKPSTLSGGERHVLLLEELLIRSKFSIYG